jgi:AbrB family looped-hinge helix DNA binding protein
VYPNYNLLGIDDNFNLLYNILKPILKVNYLISRRIKMEKKLAIVKLSSKGKVTIPEKIRKELGLNSADNFVVVAKDDAILLKLIKEPSVEQFDDLLDIAKQVKKEVVKKNISKKVVEKATQKD